MDNILLLETRHRYKIPPIGLMKLAYYHNHIRGDFVWFSKGRLPSALPDPVKSDIRGSAYYAKRFANNLSGYLERADEAIRTSQWSHIYIATMFTFEWDQIIALIEYAKTLTDDMSKIHVGGIAATLMPMEIERATGIRPVTGLLDDSGQLGYDDGVCIDALIPDYSILEHVEYEYPAGNSYFLTATRGCGNRCSFCAVQKLEPEYRDYLPIVPRIEAIRTLYGEKKDLCLLDNNVLKSANFRQIIKDIRQAGFERGALWTNPLTGKLNKRRVDFNQGLDANLFTEQKASLLGSIALDPCHIAFDHIDDQEKYLRAVDLAVKYDIRYISSYLLYNTSKFKGKGTARPADTPRDLYGRMRISAEYCWKTNDKRAKDGLAPIDVFSFPMRFIPLTNKNRIFIGDSWTPKLLDGIRTMLQPSRGGVYPTPDYFNYMYGTSYDEFYETLLMPFQYVRHKGKPAFKYPDGQHPYAAWLSAIGQWKTLFQSLDSDGKERFASCIADNKYTMEAYYQINNDTQRCLYLHYFVGGELVNLLESLQSRDASSFEAARGYILHDCPALFWCSLEMLSKLKKGQSKVRKLIRLMIPVVKGQQKLEAV